MAIKDLKSIYDLVQGDGPTSDMDRQKGPNFNIVNSELGKENYPFSVPTNSNLHAGPLENQAGRSLIAPGYQYVYGGAAASVNPSSLDKNGITPEKYIDKLPD